MISAALVRKISEIEPQLRDVLISILEEIERHTEQMEQQVTKAEFSELKGVVKELAEAQKKTEIRLNELAEAQKKTEIRINELAEAQKRTEDELGKLARTVRETNKQVGGLSRSISYALENEAYRHLPDILRSRYEIEVEDRFVRTYIGNTEINIFAKAKKNGEDVYIIGEAVLKLDDKSKLKRLMDKVNIVKEEFGEEVVPVIVTHFARPDIMAKANKAGIVVVQSFEW